MHFQKIHNYTGSLRYKIDFNLGMVEYKYLSAALPECIGNTSVSIRLRVTNDARSRFVDKRDGDTGETLTTGCGDERSPGTLCELAVDASILAIYTKRQRLVYKKRGRELELAYQCRNCRRSES